MKVGDVNGDGMNDLVTINDGATLFVILNLDNAGSFGAPQQVVAMIFARSIALGDVDGDSKLDVVTSGGEVLLGDGAGSFTSNGTFRVGNVPQDIRLGDLDLDGDLDAVVSNKHSDTLTVALNNGAGAFSVFQNVAVGGDPIGLRLADIDQDGFLDVVVANSSTGNNGGTVSILENLGVTLVGDLNGDGVVNGVDLAILLVAWGTDGGESGADLNGDGTVNGADLAVLLANWTDGEAPGVEEPQGVMAGGDDPGTTGVIEPDATGAAPQDATSSLPWVVEALGFESVESYIGWVNNLTDEELADHILDLLDLIAS